MSHPAVAAGSPCLPTLHSTRSIIDFMVQSTRRRPRRQPGRHPTWGRSQGHFRANGRSRPGLRMGGGAWRRSNRSSRFARHRSARRANAAMLSAQGGGPAPFAAEAHDRVGEDDAEADGRGRGPAGAARGIRSPQPSQHAARRSPAAALMLGGSRPPALARRAAFPARLMRGIAAQHCRRACRIAAPDRPRRIRHPPPLKARSRRRVTLVWPRRRRSGPMAGVAPDAARRRAAAARTRRTPGSAAARIRWRTTCRRSRRCRSRAGTPRRRRWRGRAAARRA
jgi:hypothetical protein